MGAEKSASQKFYSIKCSIACKQCFWPVLSLVSSRQGLKMRLVDKNFEANDQDKEKNKQCYYTG